MEEDDEPNTGCLSCGVCAPIINCVQGCSDRLKVFVHDAIKKYGFWAVLVSASVPNPFFDLAGLTCGHCGVPLLTFFAATVIGKAVIKVSLQASTYAIVFSPAALETVSKMLAPYLPAVTHGLAFVEA